MSDKKLDRKDASPTKEESVVYNEWQSKILLW